MLVIEKEIKLPSFIIRRIEERTTSLGDNKAFPEYDEFVPKIAAYGFSEAKEAISRIDSLESLDAEYLTNHLGKLIKKCKDKERPIREKLQKVCENAIATLFKIPDETLNMSFKLVDKLEPDKAYRMLPEVERGELPDFADLNQFINSDDDIMKRRLINSLIQGASRRYALSFETDDIDEELQSMYYEITAINDYLLYVKDEDISDKEPKQGACVEVLLGTAKKRTEIKAEGLLLPFLLQEAIRGFLELFAAHGLPEDKGEANEIISLADFVAAEPWDMRIGIGLWDLIDDDVDKHHLCMPYFFSDLAKMPTRKFNRRLRHIFAQDEKGDIFLNKMYDKAQRQYDYNDFEAYIELKNSNEMRLDDGYLSSEELDDYVIEEDELTPKKIHISESQLMLLKK